MRTTVDLPDDLLRRAKSTAALRGMKLKDLIAAFVESGLQQTATYEARQVRKLPTFIREATGNPIPAFSNAEIAEILDAEDAS
jgi:hypothetical protein